jgi:type I restriction enzyme S subunit
MSKQWPSVKIGDVVHQERDPVGSFDGDGLPVLGVTNTEGVTDTGVEASDDKSKYFRLRPGRFVYNPYRINVGSIGLSSSTQDGICSPAYVVFAPTERIDAAFLRFFLKSARGNQLINFHGNRGSVRSALRFDDLAQMEIPLPPLAEQRRAVARMEELAAQIHEARALRQQAAKEANVLVAAEMHTVFHFDEVQTTVGDFAKVQGGFAFASGSYDENGSHQVVRIGNVRDGFLDLSRAPVRWNPSGDARVLRYELKPDDLVISMTGTREKRDYGFIAKVPQNSRLLLNQRVGRFNVHRVVDRDYLFHFLRSPFFRDRLFPSATGTANQANIGNGDIEQIKFAPPPLAEQRRIVAELDALQAEVDALKRLQAQTAAALDAMLPAILDRAFKGEL